MVSQGMEFFFKTIPAQVFDKLYELGKPDLAKFSEGLGAKAYNVHSPAEAKAAMKAAIMDADKSHRPQVIVAHIDFAFEPPYYNPLYFPPTP